LGRVECCADDADFIARGDDLEAAALKWAHLDHFVNQAVQQRDVYELGVVACDVKLAGAVHVNTGGGGGG
jgi:hypothetical protein